MLATSSAGGPLAAITSTVSKHAGTAPRPARDASAACIPEDVRPLCEAVCIPLQLPLSALVPCLAVTVTRECDQLVQRVAPRSSKAGKDEHGWLARVCGQWSKCARQDQCTQRRVGNYPQALMRAMNDLQKQLDEHGIPLNGDVPRVPRKRTTPRCRESQKSSE